MKIYLADTGLLISHSFNEDNQIYYETAKNIVDGKLEINNGMIFENVVAQMLTAKNKKLYFYSKKNNLDSSDTMEIDFLITDKTKNKKISPIEVKSSKKYTISSLNKFSKKFKENLGRKYILHTKDLSIKEEIIYLPAYMAILL